MIEFAHIDGDEAKQVLRIAGNRFRGQVVVQRPAIEAPVGTERHHQELVFCARLLACLDNRRGGIGRLVVGHVGAINDDTALGARREQFVGELGVFLLEFEQASFLL